MTALTFTIAVASDALHEAAVGLVGASLTGKPMVFYVRPGEQQTFHVEQGGRIDVTPARIGMKSMLEDGLLCR